MPQEKDKPLKDAGGPKREITQEEREAIEAELKREAAASGGEAEEVEPQELIDEIDRDLQEAGGDEEAIVSAAAARTKIKFWGRARERAGQVGSIVTNREVLKAIGKAGYETTTSVLGVKTGTDLLLAFGGKGDIAGFRRERFGKGGTREEKAEIQNAFEELLAAAQARREERDEKEDLEIKEIGRSPIKEELSLKIKAYKEKIASATHVPEAEKKSLLEQLSSLIAQNVNEEASSEKERAKKTGDVLATYLETKIKGTKLAKDALNTALTLSGMVVLRGLSYGLMAGLERAQKANAQFEKKKLAAQFSQPIEESSVEVVEELGGKERISAVLRDVFISSAVETGQALVFRGEKSRGRKMADFAQAAGAVLRGLGIGGAAASEIMHAGLSTSISESADKFLAVYEQSGVIGASGQNFVSNAERMAYFYSHPLDSLAHRYDAIKTGSQKVPVNGESLSDDLGPTSGERGPSPAPGGGPMSEAQPRGQFPLSEQGHKPPTESAGNTGPGGLPPAPGHELGDPQELGVPPVVEKVSLREIVDSPEFKGLSMEQKYARLEELASHDRITRWEDTIQTPAGSRSHDSVWASTRALLKDHAAELGVNKTGADLDRWAETQTANLVNQLGGDEGGRVLDLVHNGDKVIIYEGSDHKLYLRFEADSGAKAGFLSDVHHPTEPAHPPSAASHPAPGHASLEAGAAEAGVADQVAGTRGDGNVGDVGPEVVAARGLPVGGTVEPAHVTPEVVASSEISDDQFVRFVAESLNPDPEHAEAFAAHLNHQDMARLMSDKAELKVWFENFESWLEATTKDAKGANLRNLQFDEPSPVESDKGRIYFLLTPQGRGPGRFNILHLDDDGNLDPVKGAFGLRKRVFDADQVRHFLGYHGRVPTPEPVVPSVEPHQPAPAEMIRSGAESLLPGEVKVLDDFLVESHPNYESGKTLTSQELLGLSPAQRGEYHRYQIQKITHEYLARPTSEKLQNLRDLMRIDRPTGVSEQDWQNTQQEINIAFSGKYAKVLKVLRGLVKVS